MGVERSGRKDSSNEGLDARRFALALLDATLLRGEPLDEAADRIKNALSPPDRGLAIAIAQEVSREYLRLKVLKRAFLRRTLPKNAPTAGLLLDMALVQLLKLDMAPHAVLSTTVELAKRDKRPAVRALSGLINGVLRNVLRKREAGDLYLPPAPKAVPDWLYKRWANQFGQASATQLAEAFLTPPKLHLTAKDAAARDALKKHPGARAIGQGSIALEKTGPIYELPGFHEGAFWVQDRSAALPAQILAPSEGSHCLDLCAAPGGKTLQLAAMGAQVTALDISGARLGRLRENLARTKLAATVTEADARRWTPKEHYDHILLDAPCTALGTFQRNPDVLHHRRAADLEKTAQLQSDLLERACSWLKPGGTLVYAVCSMEPEEGRAHIEALDGLEIVALKPEDYGLPESCADGHGGLLTAPHLLAESGGGDGFFIAKVKRTS